MACQGTWVDSMRLMEQLGLWLPEQALITEGTAADCQQAGELIDGIDADFLLADRTYDTDAILRQCGKQNIETVIPAKRNRKEPREHDAHLYRCRHLVENAFLWLKRWRGVATRYAKNTTSFLAAVHIRCIAIWANILWRHHLTHLCQLTR